MRTDLFGWLKDSGNHHQRMVWQSQDADFVVDTAMVSDGDKPFETAVCHVRCNRGKWVIVEAYSTRDESRIGHNKWVDIMRNHLPDKLVDCANNAAAQMLKSLGDPLEFPIE